MTILFSSVGKNPLEEMNSLGETVIKRVWNTVHGCNLKNNRMILVHFQGIPSNITVIQVYAPTIDAQEAETDWLYEDLQDLLEVIPKKKKMTILS